MPTGYTHAVQDGKITEFKDFAMVCARAMGACIMMRDDPSDAEIPAEFKPSTYNADRLVEARDELARLHGMTIDQRDAAARKHYEAEKASWDKYEAGKVTSRARYQAMIEQVKSWTPPTPDHDGMKTFMLEQLTQSIDFDCGPSYGKPPIQMKREDWFAQAVAKAEKDIAYHTEENAKEVERSRKRTEWVAALRRSLIQTA